ncbi:MAG: discoidin domain-containing protein [Planctomycetia bacterium]|nr:discoidin domain-containing protein [Planctomycetia bacterium]
MFRKIGFLTGFLGFLSSLAVAEEGNLALGKKYTLSPKPGYSYCTDADDTVQLTDGQTTSSYFWTQKGTVGWQGASYVVVTVDLEEVRPIGAVEWTTAAGVAGVQWPLAIYVQVSDDGKTFRQVRDLVADEIAQRGESAEGYAIRCFRSQPLRVFGRFVRIVGIPRGTFFFGDELRIFSTSQECRKAEGEVVENLNDWVAGIRIQGALQRRLSRDVEAVKTLAETAPMAEEARKGILQKLGKLPLEEVTFKTTDFSTVFPITPTHAEIYHLLAEVWRGAGCAEITLQTTSPWDPLERFVIPEKKPLAEMTLAGMCGETCLASINAYNAAAETREIVLEVEGLAPWAELEVRTVLWTDTNDGEPVAAALPEVAAEGNRYRISLQPGLVGQIFLAFCPKGLELKKKETFHATIRCGEEKIPLSWTIYPWQFPEKTTLLMGGWDYIHGKGAYNVNEGNRDSFLRYVRSRHVNAPWARPTVLMNVQCGDDLQVKLDTAEFDQWLAMYPDAKAWFVFLAQGGWSSQTRPTFLGQKVGTPEFETVVKNWLQAWEKHWKTKGIEASDVHLLIHDEPHDGTDITGLMAWIAAIEKSGVNVNVWEDPCYRKLEKAPREFFLGCDVLCPNRPTWLQNREAFDSFYLSLREEGKTLHLYSCSGPVRLLDPYSYFLLQAWHGAAIGAKASFFWALGDGSGVSSWKEYALGRNAYCPLFIDPDKPDVVAGKQMEAMAQSVRDYELIHRLRMEIEALKQTDPEKGAALARRLQEILAEVLWNDANTSAIEWKVPKDRTATEKARREILEMGYQLIIDN